MAAPHDPAPPTVRTTSVQKPNLQSLLVAGLSAVVALIGLYGAWGMELGSLRRIGQGAFPIAVSLLLLALAVASLFSRPTKAAPPPALRTLLMVSGSMVAFALLLPVAGLIVAVTVATLICAAASSEIRWLEALALGGFLAVGFAALFVHGLGLTIPLWPE